MHNIITILSRLAELLTLQHISIHSLFMLTFVFFTSLSIIAGLGRDRRSQAIGMSIAGMSFLNLLYVAVYCHA